MLNLFVVSRVDDTGDINKGYGQHRKPFFLEEMYLHLYHSFHFNGTWISDNEFMVANLVTGDITITDVKTGKSRQFFDGTYLPVRTFYDLLCNLTFAISICNWYFVIRERYYEFINVLVRFATEIKVFFTNCQYVVYEEIFQFANTLNELSRIYSKIIIYMDISCKINSYKPRRLLNNKYFS